MKIRKVLLTMIPKHNNIITRTSALPDMYARNSRAIAPRAKGIHTYISGKARVPVLQLVCYTFSTLKSAQDLMSIFLSVYQNSQ